MTDHATTPLTWAVLLAKWTEFARAALAQPRDADGDRWRAAVPPIVGLQAVTFALGDLDGLGEDERALGLDRAEILVRRHAGEIHELWRAEPLHPELESLIADAAAALETARSCGLEWRLRQGEIAVDHPAELLAALLTMGFEGDLLLPVPARVLRAPAPVAFARARAGGPPGPEVTGAITAFLEGPVEIKPVPGPRQVYRQFDFGAGRAVRDYVAPLSGELPAGQPLLVPALERGEPAAVPITPPGAVDDGERLPVEFSPGAQENAGPEEPASDV
jgi:hypothetical protein